jgi:hypothetical protein
MKRLYVAISHHGLGHLAQTAPVLHALRQDTGEIELVIRSALPHHRLAARIAPPFQHIDTASDCNFVMHDALHLDSDASLAAYRTFHADWKARVDAEAARLESLRLDAVFSNVGYLPLAAAQRAGLPNVAMCSLNWADLFAHYLGHAPEAETLHADMLAAYRGADLFLRPEPSMPMPALGNGHGVPPIASVGERHRDAIDKRLGIAPEDRLVLIGMGGIDYRPPVERWRPLPGIVWLVPDAWDVRRPDMRPFSEAGLPFPGLLASVDALLTKPGYGSFVEAAAAGIPVLYLPRPDWPETPWLADWLEVNARARQINAMALEKGELMPALLELWGQPERPAPRVNGAVLVARRLRDLLA